VRKRIFGTCLVETCVFDAHPKLPVGLRDDHRIGQALGVVHLPYEANVEQLFDFFTDEVLPLNGLLSRPLLDRSGVGVDLQIVINHLPRDPRHLRRLPSKHVDISLEEGDEYEFLFDVQITRDTSSLSSLSPDLDGIYGDVFLARGLHAGC
jgi:hypothetical protein